MKKKGKRLRFKVIPVELPISAFTEPTNCVVVWRNDTAVVVDPGGDAEKIVRFLQRRKLGVGSYWFTHAHPDHVGGLTHLLEAYPAPVRYHRADERWMKFGNPILRFRKSDWFIPFGNVRTLACGDVVAKVVTTPGHSRGSVCYWFDEAGVLLSGDTLMRDCVGATGYPGGDSLKLEKSLRKIFNCIPVDAKVLPGHGACTTIGAECS